MYTVRSKDSVWAGNAFADLELVQKCEGHCSAPAPLLLGCSASSSPAPFLLGAGALLVRKVTSPAQPLFFSALVLHGRMKLETESLKDVKCNDGKEKEKVHFLC
ncbi:hypothetical protein S83_020909 [Arachis hypogaea]